MTGSSAYNRSKGTAAPKKNKPQLFDDRPADAADYEDEDEDEATTDWRMQELEQKKKRARQELETAETARQELEEKLNLAEEKEKTMAEEIARHEEEIARLRAELKEAAPSSPMKQPLSEADAEAVGKIEEQAAKEDKEAYCTFECLDKHQLMDLPASDGMPKYQDIKRDHPTMLVSFTISFSEACAGVRMRVTGLATSWESI